MTNYFSTDEQRQWFDDVKRLVEETYVTNNNQQVTFIAHSYGVSMTMIFFRQQTEIWKNKYIARMISLAGSYGGTAIVLKVYAQGDRIGEVPASHLRNEQISQPALAYLLPFPIFWSDNEVLVTSKSRNYTRSQYREFFEDLGFPTAYEYRKDNLRFVDDFSAPNVKIHCLYGLGFDTVAELDYKSDDLSELPNIIYGNGDGTINERSLKGCSFWKKSQKKLINVHEIPNAEHSEILSNNQTLSYIVDLLVNQNLNTERD